MISCIINESDTIKNKFHFFLGIYLGEKKKKNKNLITE